MINNVTLVGRLTADPELRFTNNGVGIANFRIAVNRNFTNQQGEREADFINCVAFRKTGELIAEYMTKGSMIGVQGRVQSRRYENSEGRNVNVTEVVVEQQQFLDSKSGGQQQGSGQTTNNNNNNNNFNNDKFGGDPIDISDDDLPF